MSPCDCWAHQHSQPQRRRRGAPAAAVETPAPEVEADVAPSEAGHVAAAPVPDEPTIVDEGL